ncbi:MAG: substrate-binding domain-containing protein [Chitinophagaceae bacterium]
MKKKASIHDIARQLKVSATTVSFILNGKAEEKRISSGLEKSVLEYVRSIGFQRNQIAQSLRTGKTKIIGMLVEDIADPFFSAIARIVEEQAYKEGYKIFNSSTENDMHKAKALIRVLRERQVDGYIIAPTNGIEADIQLLIEDNFPVVLFDRYFPGLATQNVVVDNTGGAYNAVNHLFENNCVHIALVTLESEQVQMQNRLNGYLRCINENQLTQYILRIPYNLTHEERAYLINSFLTAHPALDGILFATNYLAISGLEAIQQLSLSIPEDIAIVGFDDNTHFALFSPSISAVAQPIAAMSEKVIEKLMTRLSAEDKTTVRETIVLPTQLIVRQSSRRGSIV